jgi:hypothetical protein
MIEIVGAVLATAYVLLIGVLLIGLVFGNHETAAAPPADPPTSIAADDERVIRDHARLVEQYRDMIDELYDFGEHISQRREEYRG